MKIEKKLISDLKRAMYNPRINLMPGDEQYEKLRWSIKNYGLVVPIIWNKRTGRVVSGHQRLTVLENEGIKEVDVSVVDLDETQEKQLNIALNKIEGAWDGEKLTELLVELGDYAVLTGFSQDEIDALTNNLDVIIDDDTIKKELEGIDLPCNLTLTFDKQDQEPLKAYVRDYGKESLVDVILKAIKGGE